jgi:Flp pilus assembly protein TadG
MSRFYRSARRKLIADASGQAMVEFGLFLTLLLILMSAAIDFGRALYTMQVMAQLTRQGSNLASREYAGTTNGLPNAVTALINGESGLIIAAKGTSPGYGKVIITQIENTAANNTATPIYTITGQASQGPLSNTSQLGPGGVGTNVTSKMPALFLPGTLQVNQYTYLTEIFYTFTPITPIGKLTQNWPVSGSAISLPSTLYNYTYF